MPQGNRLAAVGDNVGDRPDQFGNIRVLANIAVHRKPNTTRRGMPESGYPYDRRAWRGKIRSLRPIPRPPGGFCLFLKVAAGQVYAYRIAPDVGERRLKADIRATLADRNHKFNFVMKVFGQRRKRDCRARFDNCVSRLGEEKRRVAIRILAHFAGMCRIVAANAKMRRTGKRSIWPAIAAETGLSGANTKSCHGLLRSFSGNIG